MSNLVGILLCKIFSILLVIWNIKWNGMLIKEFIGGFVFIVLICYL